MGTKGDRRNKILVGGDRTAAKGFIGPANSQMEILKKQMSFQNRSQGVRRVWLYDDVYVECVKCFNYQECKIWVRPQIVQEEKEEKELTGFILIITTQSEQEAFAWDLTENNILLDKEGNPMEVSTLSSVKKFIVEYIERTKDFDEYEGMVKNGSISPVQLKISNSYYESWWRVEEGQTPNCSSYVGMADTDAWNNWDVRWPEYTQIDYSKIQLSDCVDEGLGTSNKICKTHWPAFYVGTTIGEDPNFDFSVGTTIPLNSKFGGSYSGDQDEPWVEWMTPYIEYTNHETGKEEKKESSGIIHKYGQWRPGSVSDYIKAGRCSMAVPDPEPSSYVQNFYWLTSIFGTDTLHSYEDPSLGEVYPSAVATTLDLLSEILYNSWDEDCHVKVSNIGYCVSTAWPFCDFGKAKNKKGTVVFNYCTVAWGYDKDTLTEDQKYKGAVSDEFFQKFRLYTHPVGNLKGLALDILNAHNEIRDDEDLNKFSSNKLLIEAAQRHADDLAANGMTGHVGSDGSTFDERINDAGYFLWMETLDASWHASWIGENVNNVDASESNMVTTFMTEWINSPDHWANMINEEFVEIGVAIASGMYNNVPFVWAVVEFGWIDGKWPGFAQVDTTDMLAYMNDNFTWPGNEDHIRVPKLFLA